MAAICHIFYTYRSSKQIFTVCNQTNNNFSAPLGGQTIHYYTNKIMKYELMTITTNKNTNDSYLTELQTTAEHGFVFGCPTPLTSV